MIVENVWKLNNTVNELLGISTTSMDFDVFSVEVEDQIQVWF
jgi:hypothetical protein